MPEEEVIIKEGQDEGGSKDWLSKAAATLKQGLAESATPDNPEALPKDASSDPVPPDKPAAQPAAKPEPKPAPKAEPTKQEPVKGEKKVEPEPELETKEEPVPANLSPKAADNFRKLQNQIKEWKDKYSLKEKELKQQVEAAQAKPQNDETVSELERLRAERDELKKQFEAASLESTPWFRQKYENAFSAATKKAREAVGEEHAERVAGLIQLPPSQYRDKQLEEIASELGTFGATRLAAAFEQADSARESRAQELSHAREIRLQREQMELAQRKEEEASLQMEAAELIRAANEVASTYDAFKEDPNDEQKTATARGYRQNVEDFINGKIPKQQAAFLPVLAADGQYLRTHVLPQKDAEINELKNTIAELTGSKPGLGASSPGEQPPGGRRKSFMDIFNENWQGPPMES